MRLNLLIASVGAVGSFLGWLPLSGCGSGPKAQPYDEVLAGSQAKVEVDVLGDVLETCDLPQDRAYFDYDSTALDAREKAFLREVASCMKTGPLAGETLLVTGYADETGPGTYNSDLAMARSRVVADELVRHGVPAERLLLRSHGEKKALFKERPRMDYDRRVELSLAEREL